MCNSSGLGCATFAYAQGTLLILPKQLMRIGVLVLYLQNGNYTLHKYIKSHSTFRSFSKYCTHSFTDLDDR